METWTHHLKQGLERVPRLSSEAASAGALLLSPHPSRWDWRQRATSRILARTAQREQQQPSGGLNIYRRTAFPQPSSSSSNGNDRDAAQSLNQALAAAAVAGPSTGGPHAGPSSLPLLQEPASPWANFGKSIPAELRRLPRRLSPSQSLLLQLGAAVVDGSSDGAVAAAAVAPVKRRKGASKKDPSGRSASAKRKGKAKAEDLLLSAQYVAIEDEDFITALAQHHAERSEMLLPAIRAYAARLTTLLDHERDARRRELDARQSRPIAKLVEQGIAIDGLQAYWVGADHVTSTPASRRKKSADAKAQSTKRLAIFKFPAGRPLEWTRFKVGDKVELRHGTGALFLDAFDTSEGTGSSFGLTESELAAASAAESANATLASPAHNFLGQVAERPVGTIIEKTPFRLRVMFDLAKALPGAPPSSPEAGNIDLVKDLENCTSWRLDLGENDAAENRMREALRALEHDIDLLERISVRAPSASTSTATANSTSAPSVENELEEVWIRAMTTPEYTAAIQRTEYVLSGCKVLDAILNVPPPSLRRLQEAVTGKKGRGRPRTRPPTTFDADCRIRSWAKRYDRDVPLVIDGDPDLGGLNASQTRAVAMMLSNRVSLVQGPPGTGKTKTIVETIRLLKQHFEVPQPILLTAHTNVAVDNLAEGCRKAGLRVVRAGSSPKAAGGAAADLLQAEVQGSRTAGSTPGVGPPGQQTAYAGRTELAECTLDYLMSKHPAKPDLDTLTGRLMAARVRLGEMYAALEHAGKSVSIVTDAGEFASTEDDVVVPIMPSEGAASGSTTTTSALPKPADVEAARKQVARLAQRVFLQTQVILSHILHSADVVCTTALSASSTSLRSIDFPVVFFDEGSMATEPVALVPLMKGCEHLAIIGDHRQLPPVVSSSAARAGGLSRSLFERLMDQGEHSEKAGDSATVVVEVEADTDKVEGSFIPSTMLTVQHRMHPSLSDFPNRTFYDSVLENGERTQSLPVLRTGLARALPDSRIAFLTHTTLEEKVDTSLQNVFEARQACDLVASLLLRNSDLTGKDIGIVTPYVAQVLLLNRLLRTDLGSAMRERMEANLAQMDEADRVQVLERLITAGKSVGERAAEALDVEVHTVDGFEGREKAAIVFSTVRTNAAGYVGFLADGRRLNVALTRAQRGLFILGNLATWERARLGDVGDRELERSDVGLLKSFARYLKDAGAVIPISHKGSLVI